MISKDELLAATIHCPCPECYYSKTCKHECHYFKKYVQTGSQSRREQLLKEFKASQQEWLKTG